jgi:CMP-N-acetylneuraminic acid synthetase
MSNNIHSIPVDAIIPAKGVSRRAENKNIRPFCGSSLLEIKIRQLLEVRGIARVCVSSENERILQIAESLGAVPLLRDANFSTDAVPMSDVYAYMAGQLDTEYILLTHVTNPLATSETYTNCIDLFWKNLDQYKTLTTVDDVKDFLYRDGQPLNFDPRHKPRSQDLPDIVKLTHVISIAPRALVIQKKEWLDEYPLFLKLSALENVDIDTELDFDIAEYLFRKYVFQTNL